MLNESQWVISLNVTFISLQLCRKQFVALHSQPLLETLSSDFLNYIKKYQRSAFFCRDLKFAKSVPDVQIHVHVQMYFYVFVFLIREHPKLDKKHEASVQNLKELVSSVPEKGGLFSDTCTRSCQYLFIISLVIQISFISMQVYCYYVFCMTALLLNHHKQWLDTCIWSVQNFHINLKL